MNRWNRIRYTIWSPVYDAIMARARFDDARRRSIELLQLRPGHRVLIPGAGTGLDLPFLPMDVDVTAIDVTPAMLHQLSERAAAAGRKAAALVMDARRLDFPDRTFDAVILHLILAVMPEPERGLREAVRVLKDGGRIAIFDKFLRAEERASAGKRLLNLVAKPLFSDLTRRLEPMLAETSLTIEHDEPGPFGGVYRIVTCRK